MIKTIKEDVIKLLKRGWYSTYKLNYILKTSCSGTRISDIRISTPAGYELVEKQKYHKRYGRKVSYKIFKLRKDK